MSLQNAKEHKMNIGVEIHLKKGKKEWIDPIDNSELESVLSSENDMYVFNNGHADYEYKKDNVLKIVTYQLCVSCGNDIRDEKNFCCKK